jgi:hypothetical protein
MAVLDERIDAHDLAWRGIALCREGSWRQGLDILRRVAAHDDRQGDLPGLFYSYLGFGIARFDRRVREGLQLCEHAVKREFYQPENYLNLARTELLPGGGGLRSRRSPRAGGSTRSTPGSPPSTTRSASAAAGPALPLRRNLLNRLLGRLRHDFKE